MKLTGIIERDGTVNVNGFIFELPYRNTDPDGYPEVLIDAHSVGGSGEFRRQSIRPYIGMSVTFVTFDGEHGYNFKIDNK